MPMTSVATSLTKGGNPTISGTRNHWIPIVHDWAMYWEWNLVERCIGWLKQYHRIAPLGTDHGSVMTL